MSQLGLGVMIQMLSGDDETEKAVGASIGKRISGAALGGDVIVIGFEDGTSLEISDYGQSCCEHRYITTDDNVTDLVGNTLVSVELSEAKEEQGEYEVHEMQFLKVTASNGAITFCAHNEHNGYYGGFSICARLVNQKS